MTPPTKLGRHINASVSTTTGSPKPSPPSPVTPAGPSLHHLVSAARARVGLSVEDVIRAAGLMVQPKSYANWEKNGAALRVTASEINRLGDALGVGRAERDVWCHVAGWLPIDLTVALHGHPERWAAARAALGLDAVTPVVP